MERILNYYKPLKLVNMRKCINKKLYDIIYCDVCNNNELHVEATVPVYAYTF